MTPRERLMTVLEGGIADQVPFTVYEWILSHTPAADRLRGLGLIPINSAGVFSESREGFTTEYRHFEKEGRAQIQATVKTPLGELTQTTGQDATLGTTWWHEFFIKKPEDYEVMQYVFEHCTFEPDYGKYEAANAKMGDNGIVVTEVLQMPVVWLECAVMGPMAWSEGILLYPEQFDMLHEALFRNHRRQIDIVARSSADIVWLPDNVTGTMISPDIFNRYCLPVYEYACTVLHDAGKLAFCHFDGANRPLRDCIASTGIDIVEAFTPPPMEEMTVGEARRAWPDKVLSLNVPGNLLRQDDDVIERWTHQYMEEGGDEGRFVIGCTEEFDFTHFERAFTVIANAIANH